MRRLKVTSAITLSVLFILAHFTFSANAQFPVTSPSEGGTGTGSIPATGEVLVGQPDGTYEPVATSTLGIAGGGGSGTVTSVGLTVPTGLTVTGSPITTSGTFGVSLDSGYVIPLTASTSQWATAYGWGDHALAGYLDGVTATGLEVAGTDVALSSGYIIPLSASTTAWHTFYTTPSNRITAGTNLSWDGNTLNASGLSTSTIRSMFSATSPLAYDSGAGDFSVASGYTIPLTATTTDWQSFYMTPSSRITAGSAIDWNGNTLNVDVTGDWTGTFDGQQGSYYLDLANLACTNCLNETEIEDIYILNSGDSISGNLTFSGTSANVILGSNFLSYR